MKRTIYALLSITTLVLFFASQTSAQAEESTAKKDSEYSFVASLFLGQAKAKPFVPKCEQDDLLCHAWGKFRRDYPYPTQRVVTRTLDNGQALVFITEPSNRLDKVQWREFITTLFDEDLVEYNTFKWMIGTDGWGEDIAIRVASKTGKYDLEGDLFAERISLIHYANYGTSINSGAESLSSGGQRKKPHKLPNLKLTAAEIHKWVSDRNVRWHILREPSNSAPHWLESGKMNSRQALVSEDQSLVMLRFPIKDILSARQSGELPAELLTAFREFAIGSDILLGGAWDKDQIALLARRRQVPLSDFPPLQVDTFALLAAQKTPELHQSYERTNLYASKLTNGPFRFRDWAPIYLSRPLINTEFGALLNITDQMLKSWSEAGQIEYLYFDYPGKPTTFPFNGKPISEIIYERTHSSRVLFNWNTAGLGSLIRGTPSILVPRQTGALPITYGSELGDDQSMQTGHLQEFENEAYDYFANLRDPNLARVVYYTLLYQIMTHAAPVETRIATIEPSAGAKVLINHTLAILKSLDTSSDPELANAKKQISNFKEENPAIDNQQLAAMLADPRVGRNQIMREFSQVVADLQEQNKALEQKASKHTTMATKARVLNEELESKINSYNSKADRLNAQSYVSTSESQMMSRLNSSIDDKKGKLLRIQADLESRKANINGMQENMTKMANSLLQKKKLLNQVSGLVKALKKTSARQDLEDICSAYSTASALGPDSWIKTPSIVISWENAVGLESLLSVGGHNLDSQVLQFEESPLAKGIEVVETKIGTVIRFPNSARDRVLSNATELARAVEHKGIIDAAKLADISKKAVKPRDPTDVLQIGTTKAKWRRAKFLDPDLDSQLVADIRRIAEKNDCCVFLATGKDGRDYIATINPSQPPEQWVYRSNDATDLSMRLLEASAGKPLIMLGASSRAQAVARNLALEIKRTKEPGLSHFNVVKSIAKLIKQVPFAKKNVAQLDTLLVFDPNNHNAMMRVHVNPKRGWKAQYDAVDRLVAEMDLASAQVSEIAQGRIQLDLPPRWRQAEAKGELAMINVTYAESSAAGGRYQVLFSSTARPSKVSSIRSTMAQAAWESLSSAQRTQIPDTRVETVLDHVRSNIRERLEGLDHSDIEMLLHGGQDLLEITEIQLGKRLLNAG